MKIYFFLFILFFIGNIYSQCIDCLDEIDYDTKIKQIDIDIAKKVKELQTLRELKSEYIKMNSINQNNALNSSTSNLLDDKKYNFDILSSSFRFINLYYSNIFNFDYVQYSLNRFDNLSNKYSILLNHFNKYFYLFYEFVYNYNFQMIGYIFK